MESRSNLDKMRNRLQVDNLNLESRKKLFQDLQKAGGKIVDLDQEAKKKDIQLKSSRSTKVPVGNHNIRGGGGDSSNPFRSPSDTNGVSSKSKTASKPVQESNSSSWIKLFFIRINCMIGGIFNFTAQRFSFKFKNLILSQANQSFTAVKSLFDPIFQNTLESNKFREQIYIENKFNDYELAFYLYQLVCQTSFDQLSKIMNKSVDDAENEMKQFFSSLFLLYRYSAQIKVSSQIILKLFKKNFPEFGVVKKFLIRDFEKNFETIWSKLYFTLEQLIDYYWNRFNSLVYNESSNLVDFLGISMNTINVGSLAEQWKKDHMSALLSKDSSVENVNNELSPEGEEPVFPNETVERGVNFICRSMDFTQCFEKLKASNDLRAIFEPNDKIFYVYVLVDFFDNEFTILWNTNIINFYTVSDGSSLGRVDPKKEIALLSAKINQFYELVNKYLRAFHVIQNILKDAKKKRQFLLTDQKTKELSRMSFSIRQNLNTSFYELSLLLEKILNSRMSDDTLVGNWDETIVLNQRHQDIKLINHRTVHGVLQLVFEFCSAMNWILRYSDLSGLDRLLYKPVIFKELKTAPKELEENLE